jgi:hypothetical protein
MSTPAFLRSTIELDPELNGESGAVDLYANHFVPLLWLALFSVEDLRVVARVDESDQYYLVCSATEATHRLSLRKANLLGILPTEAERVYAEFEDYIAECAAPYLCCDPNQALSLVSPDAGWLEELRTMIHGLDGAPVMKRASLFRSGTVARPNAGVELYFRRFFGGLSLPKHQSVAYSLAGCGNLDPAPWDPAR